MRQKHSSLSRVNYDVRFDDNYDGRLSCFLIKCPSCRFSYSYLCQFR